MLSDQSMPIQSHIYLPAYIYIYIYIVTKIIIGTLMSRLGETVVR